MNEDNIKSQRALNEEKILEFWKENKIFEKSLEKKFPKGEYVFYEGPPTANGKPGIHHLEARAFKDVIPRYKTMQGYHVRRKGGWDTHGLPVELQVEKKLGLNSKKAIEEYGIAKFNEKCKESVWEYLEYWNEFTERIGFWVDQENPYVTYHNDYIESVWNVIKEANNKKLLYKDYKVVPWCPRCGTALSSHELAQGYEDVKDISVYIKFKIINEDNTYILAWTTTPWTLPGNVALAVGKDIDYVKIKQENDILILAKERLSIIDTQYEILEELKGKDLLNLEYEPLYPFIKENINKEEKDKLKNAYKIYHADFVTTEDGTGIVHTAVMYGQDDFELGTGVNLPKYHLVGLDGNFFENTGFLSGRFVRDESTAVEIIKDLAKRGLLLKKEKYEHSYPHCWRCKTALIYYARDSWYIKMTSLRDVMLKENDQINWEPDYIKDGRFGDWLKDIKDWAISRERYWGTPLPVWNCDKCNKLEVIGSVEKLKNKIKKSGNKYFVMRHSEAESNIKEEGGVIDTKIESKDCLTDNGKKQVFDIISNIKKLNIDLIIYSPLLRTKQTAKIIKDELDISDDNFISDFRLKEINAGNLDGRSWKEYDEIKRIQNKYFFTPEEGESFKDVKNRVTDFIYDLENKYTNKSILIISHQLPIRMIFGGVYGFNDKEMISKLEELPRFKNTEIRELDFIPLPHNENYELDLHKPYIDEIELECSCGGNLVRTKEVMDVWLDSGTMPFSQDHYPFENKNKIENGGYPADFISEAIDQTRGWFYTLHAVGAIMGKGKAYKNVICLGHLLDAKGKKMSKSLGNVIDPFVMMDKYGVDTLRLWMYSVNQPGESKNFDEKTVQILHQQVFGLLYNILAFYELYKDSSLEIKTYKLENNSNVLDKWIIARFNELIENITKDLESYKLLEPVRALRLFIGDLSTWYLRRSRERIKEGDIEAKATLYFILKNLVKLMAPFAPFSAEDIWQRLKTEEDKESVHLSSWPVKKEVNLGLIQKMQEVREIVTMGLQKRQEENIPVRQPLNQLRITNYELEIEYAELIKEELNVKNIQFIKGEEKKIELDINITAELKDEGNYREFVRSVQDMRKKHKLNPNDIIDIKIYTSEEGQDFINKWKKEIFKVAGLKNLFIEKNNGDEIKIDKLIFNIKIEK